MYPCPCILIITHWMALKGIAEQSQRNAAGRLDSRYVRWGRPKVRVDSCRRLNAECLYGRWIDLNQQTNDLCALKASKESCENCVAACLPAKLTKFASLSLAAREPCGKVFLWDAGPIYFGGSLAGLEWAGAGSNGSWSIQDFCAITSCLFWPTLISKSLCSGPKRKLTEPKIRMDTETAETEPKPTRTRTTRGHAGDCLSRAELCWGCRARATESTS